ncbi:MAG: carbon-nitrogen hydrolase family protein [Promethearchaeota archaeon]
MKIAAIQIAPVFLDSKLTWEKLADFINEAADNASSLVTWGETLVPGYPSWLSPSGGAKFNNKDQKTAYTTYWEESLTLDGLIVQGMRRLAKKRKIMLMGGIAERYSGSIFCTLITIGFNGELLGYHRKIKPTYEERLVWADGDANGLKVYPTPVGNVGGLNCWENWLPLARAALHRQEEFIHIAVWPGSLKLTQDITRFMALEGRSWVISVSGLLRPTDFSHLEEEKFPMKHIMESRTTAWQNGGSIIVNPKGEIVKGPLVDKEGILYVDIDPKLVIQERQNFDYSGHYSRSDLFRFEVRKTPSPLE